MKKYIKYLILGLFSCTFFACDDYLETKSISTFTEQSAFDNIDFATKTVYGVYSILTNNYLYDSYIWFYKADCDIEFGRRANNASYQNVAHYATDESTNYIKQVWDLWYKGIEYANICIDNLPTSPIWNDAEAKRLYGEAVTLRALFYYELICTWGDVPFKVTSTQAGDEYNLPKTDRDSIYEYLIQDLADVEEYVPWMTTTAERITKGFVKGLRARMALAYAGYSLRNKTFETRRGRDWEDYLGIARQECLEIMESGKHQLNPDFKSIWTNLLHYNQDLTNKEMLYEIAFGRGYIGRIGKVVGIYHSSQSKYGSAIINVALPMNYYYFFDKKDIRRDITIPLYNYNSSDGTQKLITTPTLLGMGKFRKEWIVPVVDDNLTFTGVNFPLMRYPDIVLMFAEAENEINGPTAAAKEALASIRERAFPSDLWPTKVENYVDSVSVSKEDFFNAIVNERAWEFGGEFIRKNDLVRWNLLGAKINEMKEEQQRIMNSDPKYADVPTYLFWKLKDDGETIEMLNPDYRLPSTAIAGYTRSTWWANMSTSTKNSVNTLLNDIANGYDPVKNNHLTAINVQTITESNGVLSNDQIP